MDVTTFFFLFHRFRNFFFPPFSAMPLPQLPKQKIFFLPISAMALPQLGSHKIFFFPHFWQCHYHNCQKFIPPISAMALPQLPIFFFPRHLVFLARTHISSTHPGSRMGRRNCGNTITENQKFLSPTFYLSLSNFC